MEDSTKLVVVVVVTAGELRSLNESVGVSLPERADLHTGARGPGARGWAWRGRTRARGHRGARDV